MDSITYTQEPCNYLEVEAFIGKIPVCPICNGYGEYEDNGPHGCQACESRCIPLVDYTGTRLHADWGETIVRKEDGLHLIRTEEQS